MCNSKNTKIHNISKRVVSLLVIALLLLPMFALPASAVSISTPYPGIYVVAGESVSIPLTISNNTGAGETYDLSVDSMPAGFNAYFEGDGSVITKVNVQPGAEVAPTLQVQVPDDAGKGTYPITVSARSSGSSDVFNLELVIDEEAAMTGSLKLQYPELHGHANGVFTFRMTFKNSSSQDKIYNVAADLPSPAWSAVFKPSYETTEIIALNVEAGKTQSIDVDVTAPQSAEAGTYKIPVVVQSGAEVFTTDLTVIITGQYKIEVTTPSEALNANAYAGKPTTVDVLIKNTGTSPLSNVDLQAKLPKNWSCEVSPAKTEVLGAGETLTVQATITPYEKAVVGDYMVTFSAGSDEVSAETAVRVLVKTSTVWGMVGLVIIVVLLGGLFYIFKTYGRR